MRDKLSNKRILSDLYPIYTSHKIVAKQDYQAGSIY